MKNLNKRIALVHIISCVSLSLMLVALSDEVYATVLPTTDITLNGTAQGGVLSLSEIAPIGAGFASIVTTQGESAGAVLNRLAAQICRSDCFNLHRPPEIYQQIVRVTGNTITLPATGWQYCFSGNDKGFVSLQPVLSVSGAYDAEKHQVRLSWINPSGQYDAIEAAGQIFPPDTTNCVYECDPSLREPMSDGLVRVKMGDVLSPPASIIINSNSQEELDTYPFYMGLAPNWSRWSDSTDADTVKCDQGIKTDVDLGVRGDPWDKPLYQIIKTAQSGVQGGVWRKFLGLKSGHTYKVEVRLNTLQMDACTNAWAFSFHATPDNSDGGNLTVDQMVGRAALPDGSKGLTAGRVALYGPSATTKGKWKKRSTDQAGSGLEIQNLTLPGNVTSITVWLRYSGVDSTGVGMDWIKVEDVTK